MSASTIISKIAHELYEHQPSTMPSGRWWEHLQTNFHRRPEGFELELSDQLKVGSTAMLDVGLRMTAATLLGATAGPLALNPFTIRRGLTESAMYLRLVDEDRGREFYPQPPRDVAFREHRPSGPHYRPTDGRCVDLSYESAFLPYNPRLHKPYLKHHRNLKGRVRYWRHDGEARPTLVLIHGFVADAYAFNQWLFQVPWFYERLGLDVAVFTLPFHGKRQGNASLFSGHLFFAGGFSWINEAFRQAVMDFRTLLDYLEHRRGAPAVGLSGISLGGYTTALLASIEPRLAFAIPNAPVVSLPDLALEWNPLGAACRAALMLSGMTIREIRHMTALHCSLTYRPMLPRERLMIVGGVGDRMAPPKHTRLLWDHWERPLVHWFPGNHMIHLDQGEYLRHIAKFLDRIDFLPT